MSFLEATYLQNCTFTNQFWYQSAYQSHMLMQCDFHTLRSIHYCNIDTITGVETKVLTIHSGNRDHTVKVSHFWNNQNTQKPISCIIQDSSMKIHPKFWKVLDKIMVLILAIVSYFFIADSLKDYSSNRTNISNEALPIKEHPSVSFCFGDENTVSVTWQLKIIDNN